MDLGVTFRPVYMFLQILLVIFSIYTPLFWVYRDFFNLSFLSPLPYLIFFLLAIWVLIIGRSVVIGTIRIQRPSFLDFLVVIYFLISFTVIFYYLVFWGDVKNYEGESYFRFNFLLLMYSLIYFLIGRISGKAILNVDIAYRVFFALTIAYILSSFPIFDIESLSLDSEFLLSDSRSLYLNLADSLGLLALISLSISNRRWINYGLTIFVVIALLIIGSRGTLIAFLISSLLCFSVVGQDRPKINGIIYVVVILAIPLSYYIYVNGVGGRMLAIFSGNLDDPSLLQRIEQLVIGIDLILHSPVKGAYLETLRYYGDFGNYIHSIVSHWQLFGLSSFFVLLSVYIILFFYSLRIFLSREKFHPTYRKLPFLIILYTTFLAFFSRGYNWSIGFLALGFMVTYLKLYKARFIKTNIPTVREVDVL